MKNTNDMYAKVAPGTLVYQDKYGHFLDDSQQPVPLKYVYNPHRSTRYKNIQIGQNGLPKAFDARSGTTKDTDKRLPELYEERESCCGCSACYAICPVRFLLPNNGLNSVGNNNEQYHLPHGAIYMEYDEEGFKYPVVDASLCIRCYKCIKVCPIKHTP